MDLDSAAEAAAPDVSRHRDSGSDGAAVTLRYWAAARAAAGCSDEQFRGATLAEVLAAARQAHRTAPHFAQVLAVSSLLLGDRPVGAADPSTVAVTEGDVIEVLPPFAGG